MKRRDAEERQVVLVQEKNDLALQLQAVCSNEMSNPNNMSYNYYRTTCLKKPTAEGAASTNNLTYKHLDENNAKLLKILLSCNTISLLFFSPFLDPCRSRTTWQTQRIAATS